MLKSEIRNLFKQKRKALSDAEKDKLEDLILIQFQQSGISIPQNICTYANCSKLDELDPSLIMRYCQFIHPEIRFHYPVIEGEMMYPVRIDSNPEFDINVFGIEEPVGGNKVDFWELDLIIVPLLAFDKKGNRVGFGKGYFDRFLKQCRKDCITIGLSYFDAVENIDDIDKYDVPLQYVINPHQCFSFI